MIRVERETVLRFLGVFRIIYKEGGSEEPL